MTKKIRYTVAGLFAGLINGLFGAGGGLILVPLYRRWHPECPRCAFACSVATVAPLCAVSLVLIQRHTPLNWLPAIPYLIGGAVGGLFAGKTLRRFPILWLRRIFGIFLLYGGIRALLP